jgi:hypothetical protein
MRGFFIEGNTILNWYNNNKPIGVLLLLYRFIKELMRLRNLISNKKVVY